MAYGQSSLDVQGYAEKPANETFIGNSKKIKTDVINIATKFILPVNSF
jgi:hypothetical protein